MDFHRLARKELQTLCKKNKIPANMTNVAMADALKALEIVEGIEEFLQPCQSETAQSSIESPTRSEVTSPYVPPTGGRSTRRGHVVKEDPETAKPMTRSRRTTRRTTVKDSDASQVDATETPAAVARTTRKKASMASACRKMDSQLKECVEEEKKDVTMTPAPLGVTSRRRAVKEESAVRRVYSTRRSVRLAEKNAGLLKEVENENPGPVKKDLFTKDHENVEMNLTGKLDDLDGVSGITGGDENTNVEENCEKKDEVEVVSARKQDVSLLDEGEMVSTGEDEIGSHFEADGSKAEVKEGSDVEIQEVGFGCGTVTEFDGQNCDKSEDPKDENIVMPLNVHYEVQESDGSHDVHTLEIEITVENREELDTDKDAEEYEFQAAEQKEGIEVVSPQKQDISILSERKMECTVEEETGNHFEADSSKPEAKEGNEVDIQEVGFGFETNAELDGQKCDTTEDPEIEKIVMPKSNEVEERNGSYDDLHTPKIGITVENKAELNTNLCAEYEGKAANIYKPEAKEGNDVEIQEVGFGFETNVEPYEQKCDKTEDTKIENIIMPKSNEVEESNGSHDDLHTPEIGITVENKEELNVDKDAEYEGKAAECTETIVLEGEVEEASCDADIPNEKEFYNDKGMDSNVNQVVPEIKEAMPNMLGLVNAASSEIEADVSETEFNTEESADFVSLEAKKESTDAINSLAQMPSGISLPSEEYEAKMELNWNAVIAELTENHDPIAEGNEINLVKNTEGPHETEIIQHEESIKSADNFISDSKEESTDATYQNTDDSDITLVNNEDGAKMKLNIVNWNAFIADFSDNKEPVAKKNEIDLVRDTEELHEVEIVQREESTESTEIVHQVPSDTSGCLQAHPVQEQDLCPIAKPTSLTPTKSSASKASVTKKRMPTAVSDNKENIGSGSKLVLAKERVKTAKKTAENVQNLDHLSVRKLSKMLKEKLTITDEKSKNETKNEQGLVRPALQALPENR